MGSIASNSKCGCGRPATINKYGPCCSECDRIERQALFKHSLRAHISARETCDHKYYQTYKVSSVIVNKLQL